MKRKFDSPRRYLYALLIAIFLFGLGFLISHSISSWEFQRTSILQEKIYYGFYSNMIQYDLFEDKHCDTAYLDEIGEALDFQGQMISQFEKKFGKNDKYVKERKRYYYLLELSHFNFVKKMDKDCNLSHDFIFFFYSNDENSLDASENAGKLVSYVRNNNENVYVYSFDVNSYVDLVEKLKNKYNVTSTPLVIINEKYLVDDFSDVEIMESFLNNTSSRV
jgi:hypothetical protein